MIPLPDLLLAYPIHHLPAFQFIRVVDLAHHLLELAWKQFLQVLSLLRDVVPFDELGFGMVFFDCSEVACNAGLGEFGPGGDIIIDDGQGELFLGHHRFDFGFVVIRGGGEANVAKWATVTGCLLLVVGTDEGVTRSAEAIWVVRLHAFSVMVRIGSTVASLLDGRCQR
jgi:hypothetical protein